VDPDPYLATQFIADPGGSESVPSNSIRCGSKWILIRTYQQFIADPGGSGSTIVMLFVTSCCVRSGSAACVLDGYIYVVGGWHASTENTNKVPYSTNFCYSNLYNLPVLRDVRSLVLVKHRKSEVFQPFLLA
jgi:hypothetical protein